MNNTKFAARSQSPNRNGEKQYDLASFARKHGLSAVRASEILELAGDSRESADLIANRAKPAESRGY